MKSLKQFFGHREFWSEEEIAGHIVHSKNFRPEEEDPANAETLLFFETSTQHTWLVATAHRVYCILDDIRKPAPHINWAMSRSRIFEGSEMTLPITARDTSSRTGVLNFGPKHQRWLYSKHLFKGEDPVSRVNVFLKDSMPEP